MKTFYVETWGCQMNHHDSERLAGILMAEGLEPAPDVARADLVLLNTCSVREKAVQKVRSRLGEIASQNVRACIGLCGCVAEQEGRAFLERTRSLGFVIGPGQLSRLPEALRRYQRGERAVLTGFDARAEHDVDLIFRGGSPRAMVTVIEGCNEHCTFCIVPYTRGPERSRPAAAIVEEVAALARTGVREVQLLGQTINAYACPDTGTDFAELLGRVGRVAGIERIRFITSHPRHFSDELIAAMADNPRVSRYLHLPIQSGSDAVLKRMHRRYTREEYLDLVARIRRAMPGINLSTDIIVGFPGETDDDFSATLEILETVRFGQVFAFAFSPRPGTPASRYPEQVPEDVKRERLQQLFSLADRITLEINQALVGSVMDVLIDGTSRRSEGDWQGRTDDNRVVNFPKTGFEDIGDIVPVRILRAGPHSLTGEIHARAARLPVLDGSHPRRAPTGG